MALSWATSSMGLAACILLYTLLLGIYRITPGLHPLAKFPGPILPAFTGWYELYADLTGGKRDTFAFRIQDMHKKYGPIVRISPWELHVSDPAFFNTLYAGGAARRNKWPAAAGVMGTSLGVFGTITHEAHQRRRAAISSYFSRSAVLKKQALMKEKVELLCDVFRSAMDNDEPLDIRDPLLALATDFYCAHALDERDQMDLLRDMDRAVKWRTSIIALLHWTPFLKQFSGITEWALELPLWLIELLSSELALVVGISKDMRQQAIRSIKQREAGMKPSHGRHDIYDAILSSNLPKSEKNSRRLEQEAFNVLTASGETTGRNMTVALYHLLANPVHLERLREELRTVMPQADDDVPLNRLEELPWLVCEEVPDSVTEYWLLSDIKVKTAVLKESMRIASMVTTRAVQQAPNEWLHYGKWAIPPNTPVGMTSADLMMNPETFSNPRVFDPERWLVENPDYARNMSHFNPFHRGHRNCLGMNLAWAEMYLSISKLVRKFDMKLYDVIRERDIDVQWDYFLGEPEHNTKGVRVKVVGLLE